jgi:hypothetical protein
MIVLLADICCIIEKPVTSINGSDSQSQCERPNSTRPAPKQKAEITITRPRADDRFAHCKGDRADERTQACRAGEDSERVGTAVKNFAGKKRHQYGVGMPTRLTQISNIRIERIGVKFVMYRRPSFNSDQVFLTGFLAAGAIFIISREAMTAR